MEYGTRKQKIDKKYIDEAFKEIPLYESMAVSDRDSYEYAKDLLKLEHHPSFSYSNQMDQKVIDFLDDSPDTLKSIILSPSQVYRDDSIAQTPDLHSQVSHGNHNAYDFSKKDDYHSLPSNENLYLPQIQRGKPLESPSKGRVNKPAKEESRGGLSESQIQAELRTIKQDFHDTTPPTIEDINEFRGRFTDMKRNIMKALLDDLKKKEDDYFVINQMNSEKIGRVYPRKMFQLFGNLDEILDPSHSYYSDNSSLIRSMLASYYHLETSDRPVLLHLYLIYRRGAAWEYVKIVIEGTPSTGLYFRHWAFSPSSVQKKSINEAFDAYIQTNLKILATSQNVLKRGRQKNHKADKDGVNISGCSAWDSGIEVYKRLAKDYIKLSQEKFSRDQIAFFLLEKLYETQMSF